MMFRPEGGPVAHPDHDFTERIQRLSLTGLTV